MQKITFTNANGESVTLSQTFPYLWQDLDGITAPRPLCLTRRGFNQDGQSYFGSLLEPRYITFRAIINDSTKQELLEKRAEILRVFNPRLGLGELLYENGVNTYYIKASVFDGPNDVLKANSSNSNMQSFDIGLFCPQPGWESTIEHSEKLIGFIGGLTLPFTLPQTLAEQGSKVEINYSGTLDAPILVEFHGPGTMLKIIKEETGEYIEVDVELTADEKLYIDTTPGAYDVYTEDVSGNKTSAFNKVKPYISYFQLTKGINTLSFSAASGEPEVYVKWRNQFIGA